MKKIILLLFVTIASYSIGIAQNCNAPVLNINEGFALAADNTSFNSEALPDCWGRVYPQGANDQGIRIRRNSDGNGAFLQVASGNGSGGDNGIALMPEPVNYQGQLSFRARASSSSFDMEVVIYEGGRSTRSLGTFRLGGSWQTININLATTLAGYVPSANVVSIGFRHIAANKNFTYRMDIDDVSYESNPCLDPVYNVIEDFSTNGGSLPECWTRYAHVSNNAFQSDASIQGNELWITNGNQWEVTLPVTNNLTGIISFDAEQQIVSGGNLVLAVIASNGAGNYTELTTFTLSNQMQNYSYNLALSNYSGSYTRIGLRGADGSNRFARAVLDNLNYRSECINPTLDAVTNDITVSLDENGTATITPADVDNGSADICGNPPSLSLDITQFTCADLGDNTVTLTATIGSLTETATAIVTVIPELPDASSVLQAYVDNNGDLALTGEDFIEGPPCSGVTYSLSRSAFNCSDLNVFNALDITTTFLGGLTEMRSVFVQVRDTISPVMITQNTTITLDNTGKAILNAASIDDGSSDNCSLSLSLSQTSFGCSDVGVNTIELIGTDNSGNTSSATATVTVEGTINQEIVTTTATGSVCLDGSTSYDVTVANSDVNFEYLLKNTADNSIVDGPVAGTGGDLTFSTGNLSETTIFDVVGRTEPVTGDALRLESDDYAGVNRAWDFDYGLGYTFEALLNPATDFPNNTNIIFTIGNSNNDDIEVYFQASVEKLVVAHERLSNNSATYERFNVPAHNQDVHLAVTYEPGVGIKVYYDGVLQTKFDGAGSMASGLAKSTGQTFKLGAATHKAFGSASASNSTYDEVRIWNYARSAAEILADKDGCVDQSSQGLLHYYKLDEGAGTVIGDEVGTLNLSIVNAASPLWSTGLADACESSCEVVMANQVTIGDNEAPTVVLQDITLSLDASGMVTLNPSDLDNGSTDNCSDASSLVFTSDIVDFTCAELGSNTVTVTVTDLVGNEATGTATVMIEDNTAPVVNQNNNDFSTIPPTPVARKVFQLDQTNGVQITIADLLTTVEDHCDSNPIITLSQASFSCNDIGEKTITITATDAEGNISTGVEIIEIVDATDPVAVGQNVTIQLDNTGNASLTASAVNTTSSDNCTAIGDLVLALSKETFDCDDLGVNSVSLQVTDASGNLSTATVSVTVEDLIDPIAIAQDITVGLGGTDQVIITPAQVDNGSSDNCSFNLSLDKTTFDDSNVGANTVTLTVTDDAGNTATTIATVTVELKTTQSISFAPTTVVVYGTSSPIDLSATATSGLPVTFAVTGPGTLINGDQIQVDGAGIITVVASQAGDAIYLAATDVSYDITVEKAPLIAAADDVTITYEEDLPVFTFSYSGFVNGDDETDLIAQPTAGLNLITASRNALGAGSYVIVMTGGQSNNYNITLANATLTINKKDQVITLAEIDDKIVTDPTFDVTATVDSNLDLNYTLTGPASITENTITLDGTVGSVTITVSQAGNANYNAVTATTTFEVKAVLSAKDLDSRISIYPNPTASHINVTSVELVNLQFYTLSGILVKTVNKVTGAVDLHDLPAGVYMLQLSTKDLVIYKSIIKSN